MVQNAFQFHPIHLHVLAGNAVEEASQALLLRIDGLGCWESWRNL